MIYAKRFFAGVAILALSATGAAAQTADDLAGIFVPAGWTATAIDDPLIACIATFSGAAEGYEIAQTDGTRRGEFRFDWQGAPQIVTYEIDFAADGVRASSASVGWTSPDGRNRHRSYSSGGLTLADFQRRIAEDADADDPPLAEAAAFVWQAAFCGIAPTLAAHLPPVGQAPDSVAEQMPSLMERFPADGWTALAIAQPAIACAATFGPTEEGRGFHIAFSDGTIVGGLLFGTGDGPQHYGYRAGPGPEGDWRFETTYRLDTGSGFRSGAFSALGTPEELRTDLLQPVRMADPAEPGADAAAARIGASRLDAAEMVAFILDTAFCR